MESATEAAVHEVAAFGPEWFAVIFGCALIGFLVWKAYPIWQDSRKQKLEIMQEESKARIELERMRESRKAEEEKSREQRDRERSEMEGRWAAQNDRSISAQERTNVVLQSINTSLDTLNTQLMDSKASSKSMGEIVADMNHKVDEIHRELMK